MSAEARVDWSLLPCELLERILRCLVTTRSLGRASAVCRSWRDASRAPDLWTSVDFGLEPGEELGSYHQSGPTNSHRGPEALSHVLQSSFCRLSRISLIDCWFFDVAALLSLAKCGCALESFRYGSSKGGGYLVIPDEALFGINAVLARNSRSLRHFELSGRMVDPSILRQFFLHLEALQSFTMRNCGRAVLFTGFVSDSDDLLSSSPLRDTLQSLELSGSRTIVDVSELRVLSLFVHLRDITLDECVITHRSDSDTDASANTYPSLERLSLRRVREMPALAVQLLFRPGSRGDAESAVPTCPRLRRLHFSPRTVHVPALPEFASLRADFEQMLESCVAEAEGERWGGVEEVEVGYHFYGSACGPRGRCVILCPRGCANSSECRTSPWI